MRKLSVKRAKQNRKYLKLRNEFLDKHPICQVEGCYTLASAIHHKSGRTGKLLTDTNFFMAVCTPHHRQIEDNPKWAKENGYSLSRLSV